MGLKKVIKFKIKVKLNYNRDWLIYEPYIKLESE